MATATFVAAAINALCAALALLLAALARHHAPAAAAPGKRIPLEFETLAVYLTIAMSGLTALGAQVVWTRLLSLLLGASVYTFSIILAVFLLGLGLGSSAGSALARSARNSLVMLGWCQFFLVAAIAWAVFSIDGWLPLLAGRSPAQHQSVADVPARSRALPMGRAAGGLPVGRELSAGARGRGSRHTDPGRMVGAVYAANTVGAIVGAVGFSMILIPAVGTLWSQRILIAAAALAAMLILLARLRADLPVAGRRRPVAAVLAALVAVPVAAAVLAYGVPPVPGELYAFGRKVMNPDFEPKMLYVGEGVNSSVAVSEDPDGNRYFHVSGKTEAATDPIDMRLQRMLGHLSALLDPKPRSVLVVGFGAGVTAGTFVTYPEIERIVICEIEPLIPQMISGYFTEQNYDVVKDPRVEIVYDDARRFILTSREKFDVITSDPIHPWVKGAAALYTREYFELVKRHLNPGGVVTQWVPLYESTVEAVKSEIATFFAVFPDGLVWVNDRDGGGDVVLFGQADPKPIDVDDVVGRLERSENARAAKSLADVGFASAIDLLSSYAGHGPDLAAWLKGAAINTDRDLRLQYLAGMGLNIMAQDQIYSGLFKARRNPPGLFVGSAETLAKLRDAMAIGEPASDAGSPAQQ